MQRAGYEGVAADSPEYQQHDRPAHGGSKPVTARIEVIDDEQDLEPGG